MIEDKISSARSAGYSDDEIVNFLRQNDQDVGSQIGQALDAKYTPKEILDHLAPNKGYGSALQYGAAKAVEGVGKTIKQGGDAFDSQGVADFGKTVEHVGGAIAPDNYRSGMDQFRNPRPGENRWAGIPRAAVEGLPVMAAMLATRNPALAGALFGSTQFGENVEGRMVNNNRNPETDKATPGELGAAGLTTLAQGVVGGMGAGKIAGPLTGGVTQGVKQFGKAVGLEAGVGAGSDLAGQVGTTLGTERGLDVDPTQVLGAGLTQGLTAAGAKSPALARNALTAMELRGIENGNNEATYSANLLKKAMNDRPGSSINDTEVLKGAMDENKSRITESLNAVKAMLKANNFEREATDLDALAANASTFKLVKDAKNPNAAPIGVDAINHIEQMVGNTAEGKMLVASLRSQAALKTVAGQGKDVGGTYVGGLAAKIPFIEKILSTKALAALGVGGIAADAAFSSLPIVKAGTATALANAPAILAGAAIPAGIYAGARGIDALSGARSPIERFVNRFADPSAGTAPMSDAPSVARLAAQAKAAQAAQNDQLRQLRIERYQHVNEALRQKNEALPDLIDTQLAQRNANIEKTNAATETQKARTETQQAKTQTEQERTNTQAARTGVLKEAMNTQRERTATQAEKTKTQAEATRTQQERTETQAARTTNVKKTGEQQIEAAKTKRQTAEVNARIAKLREELVQLRVQRQEARTKVEEKLADGKIRQAKAKLDNAKANAAQSGSGKSGKAKSNPDTVGASPSDGAVPIFNKSAWDAGAHRRNTSLNKGIETFVSTRDVPQDVAKSLKKALGDMGTVNNKNRANEILQKAIKNHPELADDLATHMKPVIDRVFKYKTQEAADNAARRSK